MTGIGENTLAQPVKPPLRERRACLAKLAKNRLTLTVRNPLSLVPAIIARPRAFGESTIRRDMPPGLVEGIDRMDSAGRRRTLRSIGRASESSGFEAACEAALRVVEGGRVPDDATVDVLARRIAGGGGGAGGADLSVYDGFLKGAVADGS